MYTTPMTTCVECKHFWVSLNEPDWSEYTPGSDARIECTRGLWELKNSEGSKVFRLHILKAQSCDKFEKAADG